MKILDTEELKTWLTTQQKLGLKTELAANGIQDPWVCEPKTAFPLHRTDNAFHRAVAVEIKPTDQNHTKRTWSQFMVEMMDTKEYRGVPINGIILLARTQKEGEHFYLVQAKAEPGALDQSNSVFLTTTIQASFSNAMMHPGKIPLWDQLTPDLSSNNTHLMVAPSLEDPGIFYGKHNLLIMHELSFEQAEKLEYPENYTWAGREAIRTLQITGDAAQFLAQVLGTFE